MNCLHCGKPVNWSFRGGYCLYCSEECEKAAVRELDTMLEDMEQEIPIALKHKNGDKNGRPA